MKFLNIKKNKGEKKGFTLVETMVAIFVLSMAIMAFMSVMANGISDTNSVKAKMTAIYLAQEGIEFSRNLKDTFILNDFNGNVTTNWAAFYLKASTCKSTALCSFDPGNLTLSSIATTFSKTVLQLNNNGAYGYSNGGTNTSFIRSIYFTTVSTDEIRVTSTVSWSDKGVQKSVSFAEDLFNWFKP